jgi:hypothetical protein
VGEPLVAEAALEWFVPGVDTDVFLREEVTRSVSRPSHLQMMLELESLATVGALEAAEDGGLFITDHVSLHGTDY